MSQVPEFFEWDSEVEETERVLTVIEIHLAPSDTLTETERVLTVIEIRLASSDTLTEDLPPNPKGIVNEHFVFRLEPKDFTAELPVESDPHGTSTYWLYDGESPGEERWDELPQF